MDTCELHGEKLENLAVSVASMSVNITHIKESMDRLFTVPQRLCVLENESKSKKVRDRILFGGIVTVAGKLLWDLAVVLIAII